MEIVESAPALADVLGGRWEFRPLGSSTFCETWEARQGGLRLFVKSAPRNGAGLLRAEAEGLRALAATACIRVPAVVPHGSKRATAACGSSSVSRAKGDPDGPEG